MLKPGLTTDRIEAGCDEAGRGCLAGPVVAAAVILAPGFLNTELNDSKQLSEKKRDRLRVLIEREALAWSVAMADPAEIDEINILHASILAMHRAISQLSTIPELLLIDGNRFTPYPGIPHQCIVGGDAKFLSVAAASILAKTHRDQIMVGLDRDFPVYDWKNNKGYPCPKHREGLYAAGISPWHRKSFNLFGQLKMEL